MLGDEAVAPRMMMSHILEIPVFSGDILTLGKGDFVIFRDPGHGIGCSKFDSIGRTTQMPKAPQRAHARKAHFLNAHGK